MYWKSKYYIDTCLPFRLHSTPFLFNQLGDAIYWILQNNYEVHHLLHYLDNFLTAGSADSNACNHNLTAMKSLCQAIGAPIKDEKVEGPTTRLTFLGIILDTVSMEASVSVERKTSLLTAIHSFHTFTSNHLLANFPLLARCYQHTRGLIDLSCSVTRLHHHIGITNDTRLDLQWWLNFLPGWSGTSLILDSEWTISSAMHLFTDASGSKGWEAFWTNKWLQAEWSSEQVMHDIVWKELYAIVCTVNTWGHNWKRSCFIVLTALW